MARHGPLSLKPFLISLLREAYDNKQGNLQMTDLQALAAEYSMRLDDIVSTLIGLIHDEAWCYQDENGAPLMIENDLLDGKRRLDEDDLTKLNGTWRPAIADA